MTKYYNFSKHHQLFICHLLNEPRRKQAERIFKFIDNLKFVMIATCSKDDTLRVATNKVTEVR